MTWAAIVRCPATRYGSSSVHLEYIWYMWFMVYLVSQISCWDFVHNRQLKRITFIKNTLFIWSSVLVHNNFVAACFRFCLSLLLCSGAQQSFVESKKKQKTRKPFNTLTIFIMWNTKLLKAPCSLSFFQLKECVQVKICQIKPKLFSESVFAMLSLVFHG